MPEQTEDIPMNKSGSPSEADSTTSAVSLFAPKSHSVLTSIDPVKVSFFVKERERYELEIEQKKTKLPTLTVAPFTASIDRTLLKQLVFLGEFDEIALNKSAEELSFKEIKQFVDGIVRKLSSGFDPQCIEKALKGLQMPMHIADPHARVLHFASCFFEQLKQIGYGEFCTENHEKRTDLLCERLLPPKLREIMETKLEHDKALKKNVKAFVKSIRSEAASC